MSSKICAWLNLYPELSLNGDSIFCKPYGKAIESNNYRKWRRRRKFSNLRPTDLDLLSVLGTGEFGMVFLTQIRDKPNKTYALKRIRKCDLKDSRYHQIVWNERNVLHRISEGRCSFIIKFYTTLKDENYVYFLLECCLGGELFRVLSEQAQKGFPEKVARFFMGCVIKAYEYLHSKNIIYRDLKPENLIIDAQGYLKLIDFGHARILEPGEIGHSPVGTTEYLPPEMIPKERGLEPCFDFASDYWQLGMLAYELSHGDTPFVVLHPTKGTMDPSLTRKRIRQGMDMFDFPDSIPIRARTFIKALCKHDPEERLGCRSPQGYSGIMSHKWFEGFDWDALANRTMPAPFAPKISGPTDVSNFRPEINERLMTEPIPDNSGWDEGF